MTEDFELSPNAILSRAVQEAISRSEPIRAIAMDSIKVESRNGVVVLKGIIPSDALRYVAERLARAVTGVKDVVNQLSTSEGMERRIALALATNEATRHQRIAVRVVEGVATLYGAVHAKEEADMLLSVAGTACDGLQLQSRLQLLPTDEPVILTWQNSIEGRAAATAKPEAQSGPTDSESASESAPSETPPAAAVGGMA